MSRTAGNDGGSWEQQEQQKQYDNEYQNTSKNDYDSSVLCERSVSQE